MARTSLGGHPIRFCQEDLEWVYVDNGEPVGEERPCVSCKQRPTAEGHDACLGTLEGVRNACCGHGSPGDAYVQLATGETLRGRDALVWFGRHR